jgi:hypothetical protein
MTASAGEVTEMVQNWSSLSLTTALHCFWSPREEMGNVAWVLSVWEGCLPAITEWWIRHLNFLSQVRVIKSGYYKVRRNWFWRRIKEVHPGTRSDKGWWPRLSVVMAYICERFIVHKVSSTRVESSLCSLYGYQNLRLPKSLYKMS